MDQEEILSRMHTGALYSCADPELIAVQEKTQELLYDYNQTRPSEGARRAALLQQMFAQFGADSYIQPPFHANWGGSHVFVGSGVYANSNLTLVDDSYIYVGDHVMMGPNVTLCTATHPISPELRRQQIQYNLPIRIGDNVWLGGNVFVMPGVSIGENTVIGAGSVVTRDIPANVVAVGTPCRVLRDITDRDRMYYDRDRKIEL